MWTVHAVQSRNSESSRFTACICIRCRRVGTLTRTLTLALTLLLRTFYSLIGVVLTVEAQVDLRDPTCQQAVSTATTEGDRRPSVPQTTPSFHRTSFYLGIDSYHFSDNRKKEAQQVESGLFALSGKGGKRGFRLRGVLSGGLSI